MTRSEGLSFSTGEQDESIVDLTSNKYAGEYFKFRTLRTQVVWIISLVCMYIGCIIILGVARLG